MEAAYPEQYAAWLEDPLTVAPAGGESGIQVLARALPAMRRIVQQHERGSVLVVAHKGTNRLLMSSLLGFDARGDRDRLEQSPAALNILDFTSLGRARLRVFNDVSHYEAIPPRLFERRLSG
jgi:probable phosphoglycerate mutase